MVDDALSEAVVVWTGYGSAPWPRRDDDQLLDRFGTAEAERLLPLVNRVHNECWASDAHLKAADLLDMGRIATSYLREHCPQLSDEAVEALVWAYTFDNK